MGAESLAETTSQQFRQALFQAICSYCDQM
jgi:hypothetical protein